MCYIRRDGPGLDFPGLGFGFVSGAGFVFVEFDPPCTLLTTPLTFVELPPIPLFFPLKLHNFEASLGVYALGAPVVYINGTSKNCVRMRKFEKVSHVMWLNIQSFIYCLAYTFEWLIHTFSASLLYRIKSPLFLSKRTFPCLVWDDHTAGSSYVKEVG